MKPAESQIQERVDLIIDRFERMTDAEFVLLRSIWDGQDATARQDAWTMVKVALRQNRRDGILKDARDRVAAWVNNYNPALLTDYGYSLGGGQGMDPASIRKAAIPPMLDAIAATITADGISAKDQTLLLEPLASLAPHKASR